MDKLPANKSMESSLAEIDNVLFKRFVDSLGEFKVLEINEPVEHVIKNVRLSKMLKFVYDQEEDNLDKLNSVLAAMHSKGASVIVLLNSDGNNTCLYLGVRDESSANSGHVAMETLGNALKANFPGLKSNELYNKEVMDLAECLTCSSNIASVVGVPSLKDKEKKTFVQGLEKIIDGMSGQKYMAIFIADPVSRRDLEIAEASYHQLYSALAFMAENQITLSENESVALGKTLSEGISDTITSSIANSQSITDGTSKSTGKTKSAGAAIAAGATAVGTGIGACFGGVGAVPGFVIGGIIGGAAGGIASAIVGSTTTTNGENHSKTTGTTDTTSTARGTTTTTGTSNTTTGSTGKSIQFTIKDRRLMEILKIIDEQLERIRECKSYGMWNWGTYFVGESLPVVRMGANIYAGILCGETTGIERSAITLWNREENESQFANVIDHLRQFKHPILKVPDGFSFGTTRPCSLISTKEAAVGMSLPRKSMVGIPVMKAVGFGRTVSRLGRSVGSRFLAVGSITHLGNVENEHVVKLDVDSLTSHVFVTGSTGAGKSNIIYSLLHSLWCDHKVPFLVVEPAKGEYKDIFGGWNGVSIFGTNPYLSPLLKVNPFSFPSGIHVVEHIDRLIEILNAVWPMYAAMPAILKEAVEIAYQRMGWNLLTSECKQGRFFPDFQDLLDVLPGIIKQSDYSEEMKGNYAGALLTRVRSLTNGYFRSIFQKEELSASLIFDQPCIIDLSRVGSSETKSLLMGVVFLKLHEHRMTSGVAANSTLRHVTVLEEAHHLLRRTSFEQNQEGANLQGKSVEMISNAIAEMRTYGEGFIIADQAPGLLDQSVIRNTNSKIVLRLPDWDDRQLVGRAANLKGEQLEELARLGTGCAAIYQNDWDEAVLCQFAKFDAAKEGKKFKYWPSIKIETDSRTKYRTILAQILIESKMTNKEVEGLAREFDINLESLKQYHPAVFESITTGKKNDDWLLFQISQVLKFDEAARSVKRSDMFHDWTLSLLKNIFANLDETVLDEQTRKNIIRSVFEIAAKEKPKDAEEWYSQIEKIHQWNEVLL